MGMNPGAPLIFPAMFSLFFETKCQGKNVIWQVHSGFHPSFGYDASQLRPNKLSAPFEVIFKFQVPSFLDQVKFPIPSYLPLQVVICFAKAIVQRAINSPMGWGLGFDSRCRTIFHVLTLLKLSIAIARKNTDLYVNMSACLYVCLYVCMWPPTITRSIWLIFLTCFIGKFTMHHQFSKKLMHCCHTTFTGKYRYI